MSDKVQPHQRLMLVPRFLDFGALMTTIETGGASDLWPRDQAPLSSIYVDFGRSHYFLFNGDDLVARNIHRFIYANLGTVATNERLGAFHIESLQVLWLLFAHRRIIS